jgi:hypothetical protein
LLAGAVIGNAGADVGKAGWPIFKKAQPTQFRSLAAVNPTHSEFAGVLFNPAMLGVRNGSEVYVLSEIGFADDKFGGLFYGTPLRHGVLSAGVVYYDVGSIGLNWMEGGNLQSKSVKAQQDVMGVISYAGRLSSKLYGGLSLKAAQSQLVERESAMAFAADAGLLYVPSKALSFALAAQNIGTSTAFVEKADPLPASVMMGVSHTGQFKSAFVKTGVDATYNVVDGKIYPDAGVELGAGPLSVNAGYRFLMDDANWHFGMGFTMKNITFAYAMAPGSYLNTSHRVSIGYRFGS